jgi:hypothetical protein
MPGTNPRPSACCTTCRLAHRTYSLVDQSVCIMERYNGIDRM